MTRPDISYAVQQLSQFLASPAQSHFDVALHVLKYLKGTVNKGLFYPSDSGLVLKGCCDSDWGSCPFSAKSLTGYVVFLGNSLISWKTKKQKTTSKSTCEAEYRSMSHSTSELIWLHDLLSDLHVDIPTPIDLFCDNLAAKYIAENQVFQERTKHLKNSEYELVPEDRRPLFNVNLIRKEQDCPVPLEPECDKVPVEPVVDQL